MAHKYRDLANWVAGAFLFFRFFLRFLPFECSPNYTETQKELKWPKTDSKVTRNRPTPKWPQNWLKSDSGPYFRVDFESLLSRLKSLWGGTPGVTFVNPDLANLWVYAFLALFSYRLLDKERIY